MKDHDPNQDKQTAGCMTAMPQDMRDADTIARLERRVENLLTIVQEADNKATAAFERGEDDAARLDLLQTSVSRTANALDGWRDILHVMAGDVEGFGAAIYQRQRLVLKGLEGLIVFIHPSAQVEGGLVASAVEKMLVLLTRAESGEAAELPAIPVLTPDGGYDMDAIAAWLTFIAAKEENRVAQEDAINEAARKAAYTGPMPSVLAWCPKCQRHVAPEDIKAFYPNVPSYTGQDDFHVPCGTPIEYRNNKEKAAPAVSAKTAYDFFQWVNEVMAIANQGGHHAAGRGHGLGRCVPRWHEPAGCF